MYETAEARVIKCCTLVDYIKSQHTDDKTTLKRGVVRTCLRMCRIT